MINIPEEFDEKYRELIPKLYTAVICDVMDRIGYWKQTMSYEINPLNNNMKCFGVARTVLAIEVYEDTDNPYEMEIKAVDNLKKGDILVITQNGCNKASFWGELLSTSAQFKGANGVVIDGFTRDAAGIIKLNFPVFVKGLTPADSRGRLDILDLDIPIECGGVFVNPGDYVFGDIDGVCVIPKNIIYDVFTKAFEKMNKEKDTRSLLKKGYTVRKVFEKYGVL